MQFETKNYATAPKPKAKTTTKKAAPKTKAKASTKAAKKPAKKTAPKKEPMRMLRLFMVVNTRRTKEPSMGFFTNKGLAKAHRNKLNKAFCENNKVPYSSEAGPYRVTFGPDHRKYAGPKS